MVAAQQRVVVVLHDERLHHRADMASQQATALKTITDACGQDPSTSASGRHRWLQLQLVLLLLVPPSPSLPPPPPSHPVAIAAHVS
jgi:hypothetical protein